MADEFVLAIPENEFSMAELQGYLLEWKRDPKRAVRGIGAWVESERGTKQERAALEHLRKEKTAKAKESYTVYDPVLTGIGSMMDAGPNERRPSQSSTSCVKTETASDTHVLLTETSGDDDSRTVPAQKPHPSIVVNGAKDSPRKSSKSDIDVP